MGDTECYSGVVFMKHMLNNVSALECSGRAKLGDEQWVPVGGNATSSLDIASSG
jgi:hypothetical protein